MHVKIKRRKKCDSKHGLAFGNKLAHNAENQILRSFFFELKYLYYMGKQIKSQTATPKNNGVSSL